MNSIFSKYHANGNDFILFLADDFPEKFRTDLIIGKLCNRHKGVGADGLFIISPSDKYDFSIDYYNADGSWETLCANGSRCVVQYMFQQGLIKKNSVFNAGDGSHSSIILEDGDVSMQMNTPKYKSKLIEVEGVNGRYVDSGAPHFVAESKNITDAFVLESGRKIRYSSVFQPRGINVNFFKLYDIHTVDIKTYEKGVEQLMLSCASGSTAVIFHLSMLGMVQSPVLVRSIGGNLNFRFDKNWMDVWVDGPAEPLFFGKLNLSLLK